tara:strand:+ start:1027 stop:1941 length:915 start_codon:yes stop_codon:yes gene_type:complete
MLEKNLEAKYTNPPSSLPMRSPSGSILPTDALKLSRTPNVKQKTMRNLLKSSPFFSHISTSFKVDGIGNSENFSSWAKRQASSFPKNISTDMRFNEEIIYTKSSKFEKYRGKSLLIIGGGPSTSELDFSKVESDFMWSVNHFYLNPVLNKLKIDMAMIMGETDIKSKEFLDYRERFNPAIGFEIHDRWKDYEFDDYENYFLMHTDFYSKLGACVRMMIFACLLGVKRVSFVGLDGPKYIERGEHAFEKGKTTLPSLYSPEVYKWQYKIFWEYIKEGFKEVEFVNLGYGEEFHLEEPLLEGEVRL